MPWNNLRSWTRMWKQWLSRMHCVLLTSIQGRFLLTCSGAMLDHSGLRERDGGKQLERTKEKDGWRQLTMDF
jgi:hypothetical protein